MFVAVKDERLKQLRVKAGSLAYMTHLFVSGILFFAALITGDELLNSAAFLLVGPTYVSATVAVIVLVRGGYFRTIRDEANRTEIQRRIARWDIVATALTGFTVIFTLRQIFLSPSGLSSVGEDILYGLGAAAFNSTWTWFLFYRTLRKSSEE